MDGEDLRLKVYPPEAMADFHDREDFLVSRD